MASARKSRVAQARTTRPMISLRRRLRVGVETRRSGFIAGVRGLDRRLTRRPDARLWAHTVARMKRGATGTVRASAIIPEHKGDERKDGEVDSGCKPMNGRGIYGANDLPRGRYSRADLSWQWRVEGQKAGWGAGFSRFLPLAAGGGESRTTGGLASRFFDGRITGN